MKNLHKRGSVWYVRYTVKGIRRSKSLETGDVRVAEKRARDVIRAAEAGRWAQLEEHQARRSGPRVQTLGEWVAEYRAAARERYVADGSPKPETVESYVGALRVIVGDAWEDRPLTWLTADLARAYVARVLAGAVDAALVRKRRLSAYSMLNQARALFPRDKRAGLPVQVVEFLTVRAVRKPVAERIPHPPELVAATHAAARELRESRPELYAAYLLCYGFGLRRSEAARARKVWLRQDVDRRWWMDVGAARHGDVAKSKRLRSIPAAGATVEALQAVWSRDDYILAGGTVTARRDLVGRDLCAWMRAVGWSRAEYERPVHELRSLMGAVWYTQLGAQWAREYLGHRDLKTTLDHYAYLNQHPEAVAVV
jgi:integrase